jgi:hypothetical protein
VRAFLSIKKETGMYYVLFITNGKIIDTAFYDTSPEAFTQAENHADRQGFIEGSTFDSAVFEVVDGLPFHIRSY